MMKKVLFVTYGGGHVNIIIPIVKEMLKSKELEPIVIGLTTSVLRLDENNIPYMSLIDLLEGEDKKLVQKIGTDLAKKYHNPYSGIAEEDTISYLGSNMYDLSLKFGYEEALKKFIAEGRTAFLPTIVMKKIIKKISPDLVVTTSLVRTEKATYLAAKDYGIPTLFIEDLLGINGDVPENDYVAVMNEFAKEILIQRGVNREKIHITGQPAFESLFNITKEKQIEFKQLLGIEDDKPIVTFASQRIPETREVLVEILETFKELKDYQIFLKLHPSEDGILHNEYCNKYNLPNVKIVKFVDTQLLLSISDLVITQFSTCGLEAIFLDKPLITINFSGQPDKMPYASSGAALSVNLPGELEEKLQLIFTATVLENQKNARGTFKMSNQPTNNIIKLIKLILDI